MDVTVVQFALSLCGSSSLICLLLSNFFLNFSQRLLLLQPTSARHESSGHLWAVCRAGHTNWYNHHLITVLFLNLFIFYSVSNLFMWKHPPLCCHHRHPAPYAAHRIISGALSCFLWLFHSTVRPTNTRRHVAIHPASARVKWTELNAMRTNTKWKLKFQQNQLTRNYEFMFIILFRINSLLSPKNSFKYLWNELIYVKL